MFFFLWRAGEGEVRCQHVQTEERDDHVTKSRPGIESSLSPGKITQERPRDKTEAGAEDSSLVSALGGLTSTAGRRRAAPRAKIATSGDIGGWQPSEEANEQSQGTKTTQEDWTHH